MKICIYQQSQFNLKFSIEVDHKVHQNVTQKEYDIERTKLLNEKGIYEIHFTNEIILNQITDA